MPIPISPIGKTAAIALLVAACASAASLPPGASPSIGASPTIVETPRPTATPGAQSMEAAQLAAGSRHTCVVTDAGGARCWGSNEAGQLGDGTTTDRSTPVDVAGLTGGVRTISAGGGHTCAVTLAGGVKCWGSNGSGQLGNGRTTNSSIPVDVPGLGDAISVGAGGSHTCALTSGGDVWCWGYNEYQQLGTGNATDSSIPVAVVGLASGASAIATGDLHSCALTTEGAVWCWGYVGSGGLGSPVPGLVPGLTSGVTAIAAGYGQTCALTSDGRVLCWDGFFTTLPIDVLYDRDVEVKALAAGLTETCAVEEDGRVMCWHGFDLSGQIDVAGLTAVGAVAVGGGHACAITDRGAVLCWGENWSGQLGNGRPCSSWGTSTAPVAVDLASAGSGGEATAAPTGFIGHATGPTEVLLRFDRGPDLGVGELEGELFQPGPEFTLYGDGTVIFRDELAEPLPRDGHVLRARPFSTARLDEAGIQTVLAMAIREGLGEACSEYGTTDTDVVTIGRYTLRAGGLEVHVLDGGSAPFGALSDSLRHFERMGFPTSTLVPDRYWGSLLDASIFEFIGDGIAPGLDEFGTVPWPWPDIEPAEFIGRDEGGWIGNPRRVMSADEAAVLGLSDDGGVVKRVYIVGPDGQTIYYFSMWAMFPDEID